MNLIMSFSLIKNIVVHFIKLPAPPEAVKKDKGPDKDMRLIYLSCTCLAVITGLMIPADIIDKNPLELVNTFIPDPHSPMSYLMSSALVAAGTFMLWIPLFIYLIKGKHGRVISYAFVAITTVSIVNQLAFNKDFGLLSYRLIYERPMSYGAIDITVNLIADIAVFSVVMLIGLKKTEFLKKLLAVLLISVFIILGTSVGFFIYAYHGTRYEDYSETDIKLPMTTTGQNVVVLMMDRMISGYIPYIFSENPDLVRQFDGFTYYPNTVSFGAHTNFAAPALYGGYEYTPDKLNERSDELLKDKHNEALRVLPTIFSNNGWDVTVGDAPLANYQWFSDNSIYDYDDNIHAYNISLSMKSDSLSEVGDEMEYCLNRNFFCYGLMRTLPYFLQPLVYTDGTYNSLSSGAGMDNLYGTYQREHMALTSLDDLALITDEAQDSFLLICNGTTHDVCLLSDETYDAPPVVNGIPMYLDDAEDYKHYQCNREALLAIGEWLDFLRENGLYDNTRIILVSDHGYGLSNFDDLLVCGLNFDAEWVNPVLMVKDFGQTGFTVSNELMTNADTPYLALNGVISDPVNPYTGMPITQTPKDDAQLIYISHEFNVTTNNGTQYKDSKGYWLTVEDNIYDDDNWHLAEEDS